MIPGRKVAKFSDAFQINNRVKKFIRHFSDFKSQASLSVILNFSQVF